MPAELNTAFLVSAAMLQDLLVGKDGRPLSRGRITCWVDDDRTVLKNWYFNTGIPSSTGNGYEYAPLPNPLTLSAAGTICTPSGQDVIPFYYIVSNTDNVTPQLYYIVVTDCNGQLVFTRSGFPFSQNNAGPLIETEGNISNYVINNRFWRNIGSVNATTLSQSWTTQYNNSGTVYHLPLAPAQHDGFSMPDLQYIKNINGAADTITFNTFPPLAGETFTNDIAGEYYINHTCTSIETGETIKCYQFPISLHNTTLVGVPFTFTIEAQSVSGTNAISASIYQFAGTGNASADPVAIGTTGTITLNSEWEKFTIADIFPDTLGLPKVTTFDDALYLQINMPMAGDGICNLNFALPSIYLTQVEIPNNDFATYDQIDAVVNSPRLGDIRTSLNAFAPFGWLPMNDGTIGNTGSAATTRANNDMWRLYNLIWTNVQRNWAPLSTTSTGTALDDFNAGTTLALTKSLGRVFTGENALTNAPVTFTVAYMTSNVLLNVASNVPPNEIFFTGSPVVLTSTMSLPTGLYLNQVYFVINVSATTISLALTLENAYASAAVTFSSNGSGTNQIVSALGATIGSTNSVLSGANLPAHTHPTALGGSSTFVLNTGASGSSGFSSGSSTFSAANASTGNNSGTATAFTNQAPTTYMNVFIKY